MGKIVKWLMGCGYGKSEATTEANKMIEANRLDGAEKCSRESDCSAALYVSI